MENRYKYRAKALSTGNWVYGAIYEHLPPLQCFSDEETEPSKWYILKTGFADWNMPRGIDQIEVDPDTIGQCTGRKDCTGKEIYENDKIVHEDEEYYEYLVVEWDKEGARFTINGYGYAMYHGENSQEEYSNEISCIDEGVIDMEDIDRFKILEQ